MDKNQGRPCSVIVKFNMQTLSPRQKEALYLVETIFADAGISFEKTTDFLDIATNGPKATTRDWRIDKEVTGICVELIEFLEDKKRGPN